MVLLNCVGILFQDIVLSYLIISKSSTILCAWFLQLYELQIKLTQNYVSD